MAPPMSFAQFVNALRSEGLVVIEEKTDGKSPAAHNRNHRGPWGPVHGVLLHHTVTKGHDATVSLCRKGYTGLPGPLCHGVICKSGHVHVVGYGRANHAGLGDPAVFAAVKAERYTTLSPKVATMDGNRHFYGFEGENLGDGRDPWPAVQVEAMEAAAAAVCRHHKWNAKSVFAHKEWQPGKVDPRGFSIGGLRTRIGQRLAGKPTPVREKEKTPPLPAPAPTGYDAQQDARLSKLEKDVKKMQGS